MKKSLCEYQEWFLDDQLLVLYDDISKTQDSVSSHSQCLTLVSPNQDLCSIILMQDMDFSTFEAYGALTNKDFLSSNLDELVSDLPSNGKRMIYYARNRLENSEFS